LSETTELKTPCEAPLALRSWLMIRMSDVACEESGYIATSFSRTVMFLEDPGLYEIAGRGIEELFFTPFVRTLL